jgi:hypothetical protein
MVSVSVPGVRIGSNQHYASLPGAFRSSSWHGGGLRALFLFGRGGAGIAADTKSQARASLFFSCLVQGDFPASSRFLLGVTVPWMMHLSTSTTRRCSYRFTTWAIGVAARGARMGGPQHLCTRHHGMSHGWCVRTNTTHRCRTGAAAAERTPIGA